MTTFAQLAKGGQQGEGITLEPGDPDASLFVELIRPDGEPRMPYKQDPLPPEKVAAHRALGEGRGEVRRRRARPRTGPPSSARTRRSSIPEAYPVTVPITALAFSPDGAEVAASGYHEVNALEGRRRRRSAAGSAGWPSGSTTIAYSPDGKWLATASGDPGQFGAVKLWIAEPDGGGKPVRDLVETTDCVFAVAFSPDSKLARRRRGRPRDPGLGGRLGQAARHDRGPRRLDLRPRLQPRRQAARQRQPRQDEQGLRRREEGVARHLPRPRRDGLHRRLHPRRQAGRHRRRGQPDPRLEPRRRRQAGPRRSAASAARSSSSSSRPTARRSSPAASDKTVRVFDAANGSPIRDPRRATPTGSTPSPSRPTARPSPRGAGTARSGSGTSPTASPIRTILAAPGFKPAARRRPRRSDVDHESDEAPRMTLRERPASTLDDASSRRLPSIGSTPVDRRGWIGRRPVETRRRSGRCRRLR